MLTDMELARLMDMATGDDKVALANMLAGMEDEDVWYFKGYVTGYAEAVAHMQLAADVERGGDDG